MRYDPQSAFIFSRTDWPALGAVHSPPEDVQRFGMPLTVWETDALGASRRTAQGGRLGTGSETFVQPHPQHEQRGIILICTAWCHRDGGWTIGLVEPSGQDSPWVLKADMFAQLRCDCHCDWRPDCPGVVSGAAPAPSPTPVAGHPGPASGPTAVRMDGAQANKRSWFGGRKQSVAEPAIVAAPVAAAASSFPANHAAFDARIDQLAEEYRGPIYATEQPFHASPVLSDAAGRADYAPELTYQADDTFADPEPVPLARAERRSVLGGWLGRREAPSVEAPQPTTALEYHEPQIADAADYLHWDDKDPAPFDYPEAIAAPDGIPQLPPPADDYQLSSQAEIDSFIEVAYSYDTAPDPQPEPEPLALPAPEGEQA